MYPTLLRPMPLLAVLVSTVAWAEPEPQEAVRSEPAERTAKPAEPSDPPQLLTLLLSEQWLLGEKLSGSRSSAGFSSQGVNAKLLWIYQVDEQQVLALRLQNPEGASAWEPRVVWLKSEVLGPKPVALSARMRIPRLMPGETEWLLVDLPRQLRASAFHLEVRERDSGRGVVVKKEGGS
jgi:hypothetical protein